MGLPELRSALRAACRCEEEACVVGLLAEFDGLACDRAAVQRMATALVVAGMLAEGETVVEDTDCIATSFPGFLDAVNALADGPCAQVSA